jgi:hypothetical protein
MYQITFELIDAFYNEDRMLEVDDIHKLWPSGRSGKKANTIPKIIEMGIFKLVPNHPNNEPDDNTYYRLERDLRFPIDNFNGLAFNKDNLQKIIRNHVDSKVDPNEYIRVWLDLDIIEQIDVEDIPGHYALHERFKGCSLTDDAYSCIVNLEGYSAIKRMRKEPKPKEPKIPASELNSFYTFINSLSLTGLRQARNVLSEWLSDAADLNEILTDTALRNLKGNLLDVLPKIEE